MNWGEQHIPMILSGAGIRRGYTSSYPARLVDVAPTIERLLGTSTAGVDGAVLEDALARRSKNGLAKQSQRSKSLVSLIQALQSRWHEGKL